MFNPEENAVEARGFVVVDGMVFPTPDAKVIAASEEEIAADNRLIDEAEAAGIKDF